VERIKKEEIKSLIQRSPDYVDAFIMAMFFEISGKQAVLIVSAYSN
jgi:hypothetical protein